MILAFLRSRHIKYYATRPLGVGYAPDMDNIDIWHPCQTASRSESVAAVYVGDIKISHPGIRQYGGQNRSVCGST